MTTRTATAPRIACPRCRTPMQPLVLPSHRHQPVTVDHCADCRLVWFDELESVQLDGLGWVRLLRRMEDGRARPLADAAVARPACPACSVPLNPVQNRTRYGLFAALECPRRHGHLHSHSGLLAERGLVRPLGAAERRALAQEKHRLHCFNCGAPAQASDDHCSYCRTALVVVDLPRLAHSLRLRNDAMAPSPGAPGRHAVWACRGCGAALDPGRQQSCPHCSHLVVAAELPDVLPLLEAAEAEQAAAAAIDAERRARFASTRRLAAAPGAAPPRALTTRPPPRVGLARTLWLAGWLPLLLLLAAAVVLAALMAVDVRLKPPPPLEALREQRVGSDPRALWGWAEAWQLLQPRDAEGLRQLRRGLFDIYTRQTAGDRWPADATVASVIDAAAKELYPLHRDEKERWDRGLTRHLQVLPDSLEKALDEATRDLRGDGYWAPTVRNAGPAAWPVEQLTADLPVVGPDRLSWRCRTLTGTGVWLAPGQSVALDCRSQVQVQAQQELWIEAARQLRSGSAPRLLWQDEAITRRGAWAGAVNRLTADAARSSPALDHFLRSHTDLRRDVPPVAGAKPPPAWRALLTRQGWADMSTGRRQGLGLAAVLAVFVAFCALARRQGERRALVALVLAAAPLAYLAGRGEGAASVLLVGMYLSLTVILGLAFTFAFRLYRDLVFSRFD